MENIINNNTKVPVNKDIIKLIEINNIKLQELSDLLIKLVFTKKTDDLKK